MEMGVFWLSMVVLPLLLWGFSKVATAAVDRTERVFNEKPGLKESVQRGLTKVLERKERKDG